MNSFAVRSAVSRKSFVRIYLWSGVRKYVFLVFPIGAAFEVVYAILENWTSNGPKSGDFYEDIIVGLAVIIISPVVFIYAGMREYAKYPWLKDELSYKFDSEMITITSDTGNKRSLPWSDIIKMKESHSYLLLGSKKGIYYVDGRKLSNDQKEFIDSRINISKSR